jgi:hypothetical protein
MSTCIVERSKTIDYGTIDMYTGKETSRMTVTEVGPCGAPLFRSEERERGVCDTCFSGWDHEDNHPTSRGNKQLERARH